jgi:hypothetical protein
VLLAKYNASIDDLVWLTQEVQMPAGVEWRGRFLEPDGRIWEEGHYSVVTGVDVEKGIIAIVDPEPKDILTQTGELTIDEFERRWWDENYVPLPDNPGVKETIRTQNMIFVLVPRARSDKLRAQGWRTISADLLREYRLPRPEDDASSSA